MPVSWGLEAGGQFYALFCSLSHSLACLLTQWGLVEDPLCTGAAKAI